MLVMYLFLEEDHISRTTKITSPESVGKWKK
jgi:hypothetical protein